MKSVIIMVVSHIINFWNTFLKTPVGISGAKSHLGIEILFMLSNNKMRFRCYVFCCQITPKRVSIVCGTKPYYRYCSSK